MAGEQLPIYGDGSNVRDWLYVEDHCRAIWRVLEAGRPGEVYNVGGDSERTNLQVVDTLCGLLDELLPDSPHRPHGRAQDLRADRPGHDVRYAIDSRKLQSELGWEPARELRERHAAHGGWYMENRDWCRRVTDGSYRGRTSGSAEIRMSDKTKGIILAGGSGTRLYP